MIEYFYKSNLIRKIYISIEIIKKLVRTVSTFTPSNNKTLKFISGNVRGGYVGQKNAIRQLRDASFPDPDCFSSSSSPLYNDRVSGEQILNHVSFLLHHSMPNRFFLYVIQSYVLPFALARVPSSPSEGFLYFFVRIQQ